MSLLMDSTVTPLVDTMTFPELDCGVTVSCESQHHSAITTVNYSVTAVGRVVRLQGSDMRFTVMSISC